ncbi:MAG TPA: Gmad2 immunoglobulin-like domain-containing protein [Patescibacteria group bacterium]
METKRILQVIVILLLIGIAWLLWPKLKNQEPYATVSDFGSCQIAGGLIQESHPAVCRLPDGRTFTAEESPAPEVVLDYPKYGDVVKSPLTIVGKARGTWFFEANVPVTLKDDKGNVLIKTGGHAQSDWMTTDYVPFSTTLVFDPKDAQFGVLIINKDNPSANPDLDSSFAIPVKFK